MKQVALIFMFMLSVWAIYANNPLVGNTVALLMQSNLQDARALVLHDGTLNTTTGFEGSLNLSGWHVELDPLKGPIFMPAPPLASPFSALDQGLNNDMLFGLLLSVELMYMLVAISLMYILAEQPWQV